MRAGAWPAAPRCLSIHELIVSSVQRPPVLWAAMAEAAVSVAHLAVITAGWAAVVAGTIVTATGLDVQGLRFVVCGVLARPVAVSSGLQSMQRSGLQPRGLEAGRRRALCC